MKRIITEEILKEFRNHLIENEKSPATIEKYLRDVRLFCSLSGGEEITKSAVLSFKKSLVEIGYAPVSINSMLASLNSLLAFMGWRECGVAGLRIQKAIFRSEEKELSRDEYGRLCDTALESGDERLYLILQTICGTGIRVSELQFITVEAVSKGEAVVSSKGKTRTVFIVKDLRRKLTKYAKKEKIRTGCIFITRTGRPMDRTNIWRAMKNLCEAADVDPRKVFPHNLRHLFARVFYAIEKDIAKLADILGHSSIGTTRIYIMSTGAEHERDMERMGLVT